MSWWVHNYWQAGAYAELLSHVFWVLLSITLHELAHGWAAIWQGDRTPIEQQRMTMNPVVHMGPQSLIMFALCGIAWGVMPVNPHRFRDGRRGDVYVSAAGPAMNLLIMLVCAVLLGLWLALAPGDSPTLYRNGTIFFLLGIELNLFLAVLNLMPIPPLDGSHILAGFSRKAREFFERPEATMIGLFVFIAIFFMTPVGDLLWHVAFRVAMAMGDLAGGLLGAPTVREAILAG
ncbi:MAG: site-2 protease family protein [Planctomycetes bacterium]|nr:site-2 protease family protein [Planctomycetota bacterium]